MVKVCSVKIGGRSLFKSMTSLWFASLQKREAWKLRWAVPLQHTYAISMYIVWWCCVLNTIHNVDMFSCFGLWTKRGYKKLRQGCVLVLLHEIVWVFPAVKKMAPLYAWSALGQGSCAETGRTTLQSTKGLFDFDAKLDFQSPNNGQLIQVCFGRLCGEDNQNFPHPKHRICHSRPHLADGYDDYGLPKSTPGGAFFLPQGPLLYTFVGFLWVWLKTRSHWQKEPPSSLFFQSQTRLDHMEFIEMREIEQLFRNDVAVTLFAASCRQQLAWQEIFCRLRLRSLRTKKQIQFS